MAALVPKDKFTPHVCLFLYALLKEAFGNVNLLQVCRFITSFARDNATRKEPTHDSCVFPLLRSLPKNLVQIFCLARKYWSDSYKDACSVSQGFDDLWDKLLPQWRCVHICEANETSPRRQCPRFAANESSLLITQFPLCHEHKHFKESRTYIRPFALSTTHDIDIPNDEYDNPKANFPRYPNTRRVINPMHTRVPRESRRFATLPEGYYLPVLRHDNLYHPASDAYCGKFFFYEPHSDVFLHLQGNSAFFSTKVHAWLEMSKHHFFKGLQNSSGCCSAVNCLICRRRLRMLWLNI